MKECQRCGVKRSLWMFRRAKPPLDVPSKDNRVERCDVCLDGWVGAYGTGMPHRVVYTPEFTTDLGSAEILLSTVEGYQNTGWLTDSRMVKRWKDGSLCQPWDVWREAHKGRWNVIPV